MTVLHLSNDYSGSTVYMNLCRSLDELGIKQIVYQPLRDASQIGKNRIEFRVSGSKIIYSSILSTYTRINYPAKIKRILNDLHKKVNLEEVDVIHAHTWYSDGGIAYYLSKKYTIPYIVAVRSTDLNLFQKRLIYLRPFGRRILQNAFNVVLITVSYKEKLLRQTSLQRIKAELIRKLQIIPNGVDPFWIKNASKKEVEKLSDTFHILFVGTFIKRKFLPFLQDAVKLFNQEENKPIQLHIVGGGGKDTEKVMDNVKQFPNLFKYYGKVYDKDKLKEIFRSCDIFAMPSMHETFGLVYVEAMLQGLPILYRKGEGIDGFYSERIGESVTVGDTREIKEKLKFLCENYAAYEIDTALIARNHDWSRIARQYEDIYSL